MSIAMPLSRSSIGPAIWEQTVYRLAAGWREKYPQYGDRLESAIVLIRDGAVAIDEDGLGHVESRTTPGKVWLVNGVCHCPDAENAAPEGRCAHRIAVGLQKRVLQTLREQEPPTQTPLPEPDQPPSLTETLATALETTLGPAEAPQTACPEAVFSLCLRGYVNGVEAQLTIRGQTASDFLVNVQAVSGLMQPTSGHQAPPQAAPPTTPPAVPTQPQQAGALTFAATVLVGSYDAERAKTFWRVKGGKFTKHGVTVWPEVLEAAGFATDMGAQVYALDGWHAEYVLREDGKTPDKITRLLKP